VNSLKESNYLGKCETTLLVKQTPGYLLVKIYYVTSQPQMILISDNQSIRMALQGIANTTK
jgi:hypothetical protein